MPDHCAYPKCKKELVHTAGRRKKKYCDQNCNTRHWQSLHPKHKPKTKRIDLEEEKKYVRVPVDEYEKLMKDMKQVIGEDGNAKFFEHKPTLEDIGTIKPIVAASGKTVTVTLSAKDHIPKPERLKGETALEYKIRMMEGK